MRSSRLNKFGTFGPLAHETVGQFGTFTRDMIDPTPAGRLLNGTHAWYHAYLDQMKITMHDGSKTYL